jgi:hypothetical protein
MGTVLLVIVYLTSDPAGANTVVTQFNVPRAQRFSNADACQVERTAVLAQAAFNLKVQAVCLDL